MIALLAAGLAPAPAEPPRPLKPINVPGVNTPADEDDPYVAFDHLKLYYASRPKNHWEIRVATRGAIDQRWSKGRAVMQTEGKADFRSPFLTAEGRFPQTLYCATNRDVEKDDERGDNFDIYQFFKQSARAEFATPAPVHAVCTAADETHPWLTADGNRLYFSRKDTDGWRLYVSKRGKGEPFGKPEPAGLPAGFHHATLGSDGRVMYLQGPLPKGRWGLFRSRWTDRRWADPVALETLNSPDAPVGDVSPCLTRDGRFLYFASDRPDAGAKGGFDLWEIPVFQLPAK